MLATYGLKKEKWNEKCNYSMKDWMWFVNYIINEEDKNYSKMGNLSTMWYPRYPDYKTDAVGNLEVIYRTDGTFGYDVNDNVN